MGLSEQMQLESEYVMGTFARKPVELVEGKGMLLFDDKGKEYLDFLSGIGVCCLGHCHPVLVEALQKQAERLIHVSNYYYIEQRGELARKVSDLLNYGSPDEEPEAWKSFFANSGAEANECVIKVARLYARNRHLAKGGEQASAPRYIVTLKGSFHGRTMMTLTATAQPVKQEAFQPLPDGFLHVPINDLEALRELFAAQGDRICGVLLEPVQGESGIHPCTPEYLKEVRRLTKEHDALMMCDEVQCGVYRTGTPFAFQQMGIVPDVVSIAKGIAGGMVMGMCAAPASIADVAFAPGDHGSTFGGSNLAVAASIATLGELERLNIGESVLEVGAYFKQELAKLNHIKEVRGMGLMVAADLSEDAPSAPEVVAKGLEAGLILNYTGPCTLRFLPPLICSKADIDALMVKLAEIV